MLKLAALFATTALFAVAAPKPPNVLLILADDLGYSDIGCYGGEIETPNLDSLAKNGLRFTQCYNTARCWPTRTALLSGYYPQQTRTDPKNNPLPEWTKLLPHWLKSAGYRSYHSGKWHVFGAEKILTRGEFDRSYCMLDSDHNFYPSKHELDDNPLPPIQKGSNYYTTVAFTDHAITCLKDHVTSYPGKPFFSYVAYTVPHFPLQAPQADIDRCRARYEKGWETARAARYKRLTDMGLVSCSLSAVEYDVGAPYDSWSKISGPLGKGEINRPHVWDTLAEEQKKFQIEKMAIHAAMVEVMDREIGRLIAQVKAMGELDNTLIMFLSDNGCSAEMMIRGDGHNPDAPMGSGESFLCLGPGWSTVSNTPFRRHKTWNHEGGISTPLVVHWPAGIEAKGELRKDLCHVIDIVPTILDIAKIKPALPPDAPPIHGITIAPAFEKDGALTRDTIYFRHEGNRALRIGNFKIVSSRRDGGEWELYDMAKDRGEQKNLASEQPERVQTMAATWEKMDQQFAKDSGAPAKPIMSKKKK
jgi:arylsulfatase A-like enzyme